MNELASKLLKTFFRSKKSFLSSELELVKVASKTDLPVLMLGWWKWILVKFNLLGVFFLVRSWGDHPTFTGEMNELASKLFKTFSRSKKSFLSSENELVEVTSKIDILGDFMRQNLQIQWFCVKAYVTYCGGSVRSDPILKNSRSFFDWLKRLLGAWFFLLGIRYLYHIPNAQKKRNFHHFDEKYFF